MVVLGISIGTRMTGIAIINDTELVAWQSHTFPAQWSKEKMDRILTRYEKYMRSHKVTLVVVKIPRVSHLNKSLKNLLNKLNALVAFHGCLMDYTTMNEIKTQLPTIENAWDMQDYALHQYPALLPEHTSERVNKRPYHNKMFEAVVIAHLWKDREL